MALEGPVTPRRVKVYELQQENWHDRGTGFCTGEIVNDEAYIFVKSEEETDKYLLEAKIYKEVQYQKQQDTLIVWTDPDETDLALSFQEGEGCATIWDFITEIQKHLGHDDNQSDDANDSVTGSVILPNEPTLGALADIERSLTIASHTQYARDSITRDIQDLDYIARLIPLLSMAEDLESLSDLHTLCRIMKLIILMNDNTILEQILLDDYIVGVVGMLEYDPEFPMHKANHREYICDESRFKEVVPIPDEQIRNKIRYTFRLQYLKDVVLARLLDDPTFSMLSSMIYFYQVDIVNYLQQNDEFTAALFGIFKPLELNKESDGYQDLIVKRRDCVRLLQQFCHMAKNLQAQQRSHLYTGFIKKGFFDVIEFALTDELATVRVIGTELILSIIDNDPSLIRSAVLKSSGTDNTIIDTLIGLFLNETDFGVTSQISEAIQVLLDPSSGQPLDTIRKASEIISRQRADDPEIEMFLDSFYNQPVRRLFQTLSNLQDPVKISSMSVHDAALNICLCDLVCSIIRLHGYRSRSFLVESSVLTSISKLFKSPSKPLRLAALRCFRQCIGANDEFYNRFLIKSKLFGPILDLMVEFKDRNNLLNSACLELFEFIRVGSSKPDFQRNMKTVVTHIVEVYRPQLDQLLQFETIKALIQRYEQLHNVSSPADSSSTDVKIAGIPRGRWNGIPELEPDEDEYFNTSDDEEEVEDTSKESVVGVNLELAPVYSSPETLEVSVDASLPVAISSDGAASPEHSGVEKSSPMEESSAPGGMTPLQLLGDKRRREGEAQEEEDELVKLASKKKRKSTGLGSRSPSPGSGTKPTSTPTKGFFSNAGKKIAISLGAKRFKEREGSAK